MKNKETMPTFPLVNKNHNELCEMGYTGHTWQAIVGYLRNECFTDSDMFFIFDSKSVLDEWLESVSREWLCDKIDPYTKKGDRLCIDVYHDHLENGDMVLLEESWVMLDDGNWVWD